MGPRPLTVALSQIPGSAGKMKRCHSTLAASIILLLIVPTISSLGPQGSGSGRLQSGFRIVPLQSSIIDQSQQPLLEKRDDSIQLRAAAKGSSTVISAILRDWLKWTFIVVPIYAIVNLLPIFGRIPTSSAEMMKLGAIISITVAIIIADGSTKTSDALKYGATTASDAVKYGADKFVDEFANVLVIGIVASSLTALVVEIIRSARTEK